MPYKLIGSDEKHLSAKFPLWGVVGSDLGSCWGGRFRRQAAVVNCGSEMFCREFSLSSGKLQAKEWLMWFKLLISICYTEV